MHRDLLLRGVLIVCVSSGLAAVAPPDQPVDGAQSSLNDASKVRAASKALKDTPDAMAAKVASTLKSGPVATLSEGPGGGVALVPPGTQVYKNDLPDGASLIVYTPGAGQRMADDLTLANGGCTVTYYSLQVGGLNTSGSPTFDVHTALWDDDPCDAGSTVIAGTESDSLGVLNDGFAYNLEVTLDPTVPVPAKVWLAATFSTNDSGWVRAARAEVGSTSNIWSEDHTKLSVDEPETGCISLQFNTGWGGFWATVNCTVPGDPVGACCNGNTCTQTTQANCAAGVWQGAFTSCQPNVCLSGACCTGVNFSVCTDTTQDQCIGGLFHAGSTCAANACGPTFKVYENNFATGIFDVIATGTKWGDDLKLGSGAPCQLSGYDLLMAGGQGCVGGRCAVTNELCSFSSDCPPLPPFNAHVELWTNNDRGTAAEGDDIPGVLIPGTQFDFQNVPADLFTQRLLAGPYTGIQLPKKVWVVMTTSSNRAGPITAGPATIGFSVDGFAIFNFSGSPNVWTPGFWYDGFDPTGCPGGTTCTPAGSFRVQVWCQGYPPTGACCNDDAGTCIGGVLQAECNGRWAEGAGCDPDPFDPPCGTSECCYPVSLDPPLMQCQNATPSE
ncbi:MAG: hypothetical protein Q7R41_18480, partial [Phycisphaerales bacterium]|nr:hypothetical protein [Phycisphaerales bacterium]